MVVGCYNCKDSSLILNGWKGQNGKFVHLCGNCFSVYKRGQFCEMFHSNQLGWRDCESCKKLIHCGCIVSHSDYHMQNSGGILCNACSLNSLMAQYRSNAESHPTESRKENVHLRRTTRRVHLRQTNPKKNKRMKRKRKTEDTNGAQDKSEDENSENTTSEEHVSDPEPETESEEENTKKRKRGSDKSSAKKELAVKLKGRKVATPIKTSSSQKKATPATRSSTRIGSKVREESDSGPKTLLRKKKKDAIKEKPVTPKKAAHKENSGKKTVKEKKRLSDDDLRNAICDILMEVNFYTATFYDILWHLAKRFNTDLTPRKPLIKLMIQEELIKLAENEEDEE